MYFDRYKDSVKAWSILKLASEGIENPDAVQTLKAVEETGSKGFSLGNDWEGYLSNDGLRVTVTVGIVDGTNLIQDDRVLRDPTDKPESIKANVGDLRAKMTVQFTEKPSREEIARQTNRLRKALASYAQQVNAEIEKANLEVAAQLAAELQKQYQAARQRGELLSSLEQDTGMKFRDG